MPHWYSTPSALCSDLSGAACNSQLPEAIRLVLDECSFNLAALGSKRESPHRFDRSDVGSGDHCYSLEKVKAGDVDRKRSVPRSIE